MEEYIIILIIFILATLLGFFINKAMEADKFRKLEREVRDTKELRDRLAQSERDLVIANQEKIKLAEAEEKVRNDFYQLTITYKNLQDEFLRKQEILRQQYEVPPELPLLKDSNKLLAKEIEKLRKKLHKWKTKDYVFENKALQKKLKKSNAKLEALQTKIDSQEDLKKYQALYAQIVSLSEEAKVLIKEKNTSSKSSKKEKKKKEPVDELGFFKHQPEFKKEKIFSEIMEDTSSKNKNEGAFDIEDENIKKKTLMDLVDIDDKVYAILLNAGIETFEDLSESKIADLRLLLEISGVKPKKYQYHTWPIQARLAEKDEWDVINEYKKG